MDHPHGGGRGKSKGNRHPVSPWGVPVRSSPTQLILCTSLLMHLNRPRAVSRRGGRATSTNGWWYRDHATMASVATSRARRLQQRMECVVEAGHHARDIVCTSTTQHCTILCEYHEHFSLIEITWPHLPVAWKDVVGRQACRAATATVLTWKCLARTRRYLAMNTVLDNTVRSGPCGRLSRGCLFRRASSYPVLLQVGIHLNWPGL